MLKQFQSQVFEIVTWLCLLNMDTHIRLLYVPLFKSLQIVKWYLESIGFVRLHVEDLVGKIDNCKFKFRTRFIMMRIKPSMHDSNILDSTYIINMISENMIMKQIWSQNTYCAGAAGKTKGADETKTVLRTERSNRRCRRRYAAAPDLDGGRAVAKKMSSRA